MSAPRLYFDWNSTTPPLREAIEAITAAWADGWGNPASVHAEGRAARAHLDEARATVADLFDARPSDVIFTSGGTEATNIALSAPFADGQGALVYAPIEHASVHAVATHLSERGVEIRKARVHKTGTIDIDDVRRLLARGGVRLVAVQAVNGETGVVQPVDKVAALAHQHGAVVHVDAIQAVGRVAPPSDGWLAHADTVAVAAHKIRGPKGIGALVSRVGHPLRPILRGGSQERGLRPGTQDAALASGFAVAAAAAKRSLPEYEAVASVRDALQRGLLELGCVAINGEGLRAPQVVHASFRGWSSPELVAALDLEGLAVSGGAACHAGVREASSTLLAMWGDSPEEHWRFPGTVRFSLPPWATHEDAARALGLVRGVMERGAAALYGG